MKKTITTITVLLTIIISFSCIQDTTQEKWSDVFEKYNMTGTFVLKKLATPELKIHNKSRSEKQYVPASTFKILNSMIAIQTSAIGSVNDTIKWDGTDKGWKKWNSDQTMRTAMPISCVWFYQELAKRIGEKQMQTWIDKTAYGNMKISNEIDQFWLEGKLEISAKQQVEFLEKLVENQLPFDKPIQDTVKEIMITDSTDCYTIHSKTGWAKQIGWNVGYIEASGDTWIFAMNMDMKHMKEAKYRKLITYDILREEGIIK